MAASLAEPAGRLPARSSLQRAPQAGQMTGTRPLMGMHLARDRQQAKAPGVLTEELAVVGAAGKGQAEAGALGEAAETAGVRGGAAPPRETAGKGLTLRQAGTAGTPPAGAARARPEVRPLADSLLCHTLLASCRQSRASSRAANQVSSHGHQCEARSMCTGSWQGGSRGGRGRSARGDDREGQYGRSGQAWQPRGRPDEPALPRAPQLADKLQGEALYGVNPVLGALQALRRDCHTLYVQEGQQLLGTQLMLSYSPYRAFPCTCTARRDVDGCLTNFLPSQWQKIKWRLPQSNADLRTSTQHHCCCAFPQVPATATLLLITYFCGQYQIRDSMTKAICIMQQMMARRRRMAFPRRSQP